MTGTNFSRLSKIPPQPWQVDHGGGINVGYTCHMAAMHWAQMALGSSQTDANRIVGAFARLHCPGCKGRGPHGSVLPSAYGNTFCRNAVPISDRASLYKNVQVGDVLITGHHRMPMHTMIVRQKRGEGHITVRGFNNFGTLGTGIRDHYDPKSHNIAKDKYWGARDGGFGRVGVPIPLWVVPHNHFMQASRMLRHHVGK